MQPKIPIRISRPLVWSHNTNYTGAVGLHSENSPATRARQISIDKGLSKVISVLKDMERKEVKKHEKSKKDIQNSMLAYTEKVKQINAKRLYASSMEGSDMESRISISNRGSLTDRSSQSSSGSETRNMHRRTISPVKNRRISLPKLGLSNKRKIHERRLSSVSDSATLLNSSQSRNIRSEKLWKLKETHLMDDASEQVFLNEKSDELNDVVISPFPYDSYNYEAMKLNIENKYDTNITPRKRTNYKQYKEEKDLERQRATMRKKTMTENDPFDHEKEFLREQARNRKAALLLEKARQDALKGKKDIWNTFCYSTAVEELLKKSDPLSFVATEEDLISKVEVDKEGTIKQTFGPGVLSIIGVDELNNIQGMRIKWSAKHRPQPMENDREDYDKPFLPPITIGTDTNNFCREITQDQENFHFHKLETQSSFSVVSVDG